MTLGPVGQAKLDMILGRLSGVKRSSDGSWMALCPAHAETHASLHISVKDEKALTKCFAGCEFPAIHSSMGLEASDFFLSENGNGFHGPVTLGPEWEPPCTLEAFARIKKLPLDFLRAQGLADGRQCVEVPYRDEKGETLVTRRRVSLRGPNHYRSKHGDKLFPYGLWRLPEWRRASKPYVVLCEGESDALTLWHHGIAALGIPGASAIGCLAPEYVIGFQAIYILADTDEAGKAMERALIDRLAGFNCGTFIKLLRLPPGCKDVSELHCLAPDSCKEKLRMMFRSALRPDELEDHLYDCAQDTPTAPVKWLWWPYIPANCVSIIYGRGGVGKSFVLASLAACVTAGKPFPWEIHAPDGSPANVLLVADEDDMGRVVRPRFESCGGDASRLYSYRIDKINGLELSNPVATARLIKAVTQLKPLLVVVDPIVSFLGSRMDMNKATQVRASLNPLVWMAENCACSVLVSAHSRKGSSEQAIDMLMGSADFANAPRSGLCVADDPIDETVKLISHPKHNMMPQGDTLRYKITGDRWGAKIEWLEKSPLAPNEIAMANMEGRPENKNMTARVLDVMRRELTGREDRRASEVEAIIREETGGGDKAIRRAKDQLGVKPRQVRDPSGASYWVWSLRKPASTKPSPERSFTESRREQDDNDNAPF